MNPMNQPKHSFLLPFLVCLLLATLFVGCRRDEIQAEKSLLGAWDVSTIFSQYGEFSNNVFDPTESVRDSGQLGSFTFTEAAVAYEFTRNDTLFTGSGAWDLTTERVNAGFTRVTAFTLTIENLGEFDVTFEDATSNSEKNAEAVTLIEAPADGAGGWMQVEMEKR